MDEITWDDELNEGYDDEDFPIDETDEGLFSSPEE